MRAKEEAERKARLDRVRKQKAERERMEKRRQEQEAARATEAFFRDRATSVEPSASKSTVSTPLLRSKMESDMTLSSLNLRARKRRSSANWPNQPMLLE